MTTDPSPANPSDAHAVADALAAAGAPQGAADAHGVLCALLCVDPTLDAEVWLNALGAQRPAAEAIVALHVATRSQLLGEDYALVPWLPADTTPLAQRVTALAEWSQGFLGGLGLGGVASGSLADEAAEFVDDLAALAQAAHDGDDEASEQDYAELVEHLRVGTYLVRDALRPARGGGRPA